MLKLGPNDKIIPKLSSEKLFKYLTYYQVSKLLLQYVVGSIAPQILNMSGEPEAIVTTMCPGLCRTNMGRKFGTLLGVTNGLFQ